MNGSIGRQGRKPIRCSITLGYCYSAIRRSADEDLPGNHLLYLLQYGVAVNSFVPPPKIIAANVSNILITILTL